MIDNVDMWDQECGSEGTVSNAIRRLTTQWGLPQMKEQPMSDTPTGLLGTRWRNKRSGHEYYVAMTDDNTNSVFLVKLAKGGRSTWKYAPHLPFDYEEIKDGTQ